MQFDPNMPERLHIAIPVPKALTTRSIAEVANILASRVRFELVVLRSAQPGESRGEVCENWCLVKTFGALSHRYPFRWGFGFIGPSLRRTAWRRQSLLHRNIFHGLPNPFTCVEAVACCAQFLLIGSKPGVRQAK
jgi:hypothetical protein